MAKGAGGGGRGGANVPTATSLDINADYGQVRSRLTEAGEWAYEGSNPNVPGRRNAGARGIAEAKRMADILATNIAPSAKSDADREMVKQLRRAAGSNDPRVVDAAINGVLNAYNRKGNRPELWTVKEIRSWVAMREK